MSYTHKNRKGPFLFRPNCFCFFLSITGNRGDNSVSIWGKIYPSFWLGVWQTFGHMHSTSGDSLRGLGVIRQVGEHFMIIGKLKPVHQSVVLFSFPIQGPKL